MSPTGLRARNRARTRDDIIEAALGLFEKQGYDATTCEDIAAAADVSVRTFFRYFDTKVNVVLAGRSDEEGPHAVIAEVLDRPAGEPPVEVLRHALRHPIGVLESQRDLVVRQFRVMMATPASRSSSASSSTGSRIRWPRPSPRASTDRPAISTRGCWPRQPPPLSGSASSAGSHQERPEGPYGRWWTKPSTASSAASAPRNKPPRATDYLTQLHPRQNTQRSVAGGVAEAPHGAGGRGHPSVVPQRASPTRTRASDAGSFTMSRWLPRSSTTGQPRDLAVVASWR
jgi:AcrR family transcriptional regulator